jgi:hypothetical protein
MSYCVGDRQVDVSKDADSGHVRSDTGIAHVAYLQITAIDLLAFLTAISVGVCLVNPLVGLFELSSMFSLSPSQYLMVQRAQRRAISFFAVAIAAASFLMLAYALAVWPVSLAFSLSMAACLCLAAAEFIYWGVHRWMVAATNRWTVVPDKFELARKKWEYAKVIRAGFTLVAFVTILLSITAAEVTRTV